METWLAAEPLTVVPHTEHLNALGSLVGMRACFIE